ncbi:MAG TPA: hypothetical protein VI485_29140 [Vicinamibacterales bacterium]|nr:hypothetical protein [Vicinamibacterales bacterium]
MNAEVSRRIFVGSVAAGLPLLAGAGAQSFAQSAKGAAHVHPADSGAPDAVLEHITRQLAGIHNRAKDRGVTGEDARAIAAHFRTMTVYAAQIGLDDRTKKAFGALLKARGKEAALYVGVDKAAMRKELKRYGIDADERTLDPQAVDHVTRVRSRDDLLKSGLTGVLTRAAVTFDTIATELDRRGGQTARVVRVQTWETGFCQQMNREMIRLQMDAAFVCAASFYYFALTGACAMITAAIGVQSGVYLYYC